MIGYFGVHRSSKRFSRREIVALWINRARHLAQQLHHTTTIATEADASASLVAAIREGVAILLKNMVLLGKTSLDQGEREKSGVDANFYVPGEGTALFAMAERFVDSFGYAGDDSPLERAILFENLVTLITTMVRSPDYISKKDDFPRFELSADDRRWYGLFDSTKAYQVTLQHAHHVDSHRFGDKLARYNPGLSVEEHYRIPTSPPPDIPTRPNTPETEVISVDSSALAIGLEIGKKRAAEDDGRLIDLRRERGLVLAGGFVQEGEDALEAIVVPSSKIPLSMKVAGRPVPVPHIFLHGPILRRLSLPVYELDANHWAPVESFPDFFQYCLRPLVYFLHSAVTQGFEKEVVLANYSAPEISEIRYWLTRIILHCRLLDLAKSAYIIQYLDDWAIPFPAEFDYPGESVVTFEILYRICYVLGFPTSKHIIAPLDKKTLHCAILSARESQERGNTARDFYPFDVSGELTDHSYYDDEYGVPIPVVLYGNQSSQVGSCLDGSIGWEYICDEEEGSGEEAG
ncbi:hypothetical protein DFH06DRAFT_1148648 [Mycena polygramma]|nr:hypothetical protein DFH06DRAFT_1148648 [Mycena polygramma]